MKHAVRGLAPALLALGVATGGGSQETPPAPLFDSDDPLAFSLVADFAALEGDRTAGAPNRPATLVLAGSAGEERLDIEVRTRGSFRLDPANCSFPPLRLEFPRGRGAGTPFEGQEELKMVGSCRPERDSYEQLVLKEYLIYRTFRLVSPIALGVRLARVTYVDTSGESEPSTRFAFLIEDDDALAARLGGRAYDIPEGRNLPAAAFVPSAALGLAVFEYMIGNPDWSAVAGQNVEIVDLGGVAYAVPYDFDSSGLVDAPYAVPPEALNLRSVRERLYRGWCSWEEDRGNVLARFRDAEPEVMALWRDFPHLDEGERTRALDYLRGFFDDIGDDRLAERRLFRDCRAATGREASAG